MITHVSIKITGGGHNLMKIPEFANLPFEERMQLISERKITFLDEDGEIQPLLDGIKFTTEYLRNKGNS